MLWPGARPSDRPSQAGIAPELLNVGSRKQHHSIAQEFSNAKDFGEISMESPPTKARNAQVTLGRYKLRYSTDQGVSGSDALPVRPTTEDLRPSAAVVRIDDGALTVSSTTLVVVEVC